MAKPKMPFVVGATLLDSERVQIANPFMRERFGADYVPGHGELVMANDVQRGRLSEAEKQRLYAQIGATPKPLPLETIWVRVSNPAGGPSYSADVDAAEFRRRGYRPVTLDQLRAVGYDMPPAGRLAEDGTIRREDTQLWAVDGEAARAYERWLIEENLRMEEPSPVAGRDSGQELSVTEERRRTLQVRNTPED